MKLAPILLEMRKNPHINKKTTFYSEMKKISKQHDTSTLLVSFMDINKKGINPSTKYNTPAGLYCYQFDFIMENLEYNIHSNNSRPFPIDTVKYIKVFKINKPDKLYQVNDTLSNKQKTMLQQYVPNLQYNNIGELMQGFHDELKFLSGRQKTSLLYKLGIDGVIDNGTGVIHNNEPSQVLIIKTSIVSTLDVLSEDTDNKIISSDFSTYNVDTLVSVIKLVKTNRQLISMLPTLSSWVQNNDNINGEERGALLTVLINLFLNLKSPHYLLKIIRSIIIDGDYSNWISEQIKISIVQNDELSNLFANNDVQLYNIGSTRFGADYSIEYCEQQLLIFYDALMKDFITQATFIKLLHNINKNIMSKHINESYVAFYHYESLCKEIMHIYENTKFAHDAYEQIVSHIITLPEDLSEELSSNVKYFVSHIFDM